MLWIVVLFTNIGHEVSVIIPPTNIDVDEEKMKKKWNW